MGRAFVAVRDSDIAAEAMGVNLTRYKLLAFAISSFYTGVSGALMAQYLGHLEPQTFNISESMNLFVAVIVGGLASIEGSVFGAAFVVLVPALFGELRWAVPVLFGVAILVGADLRAARPRRACGSRPASTSVSGRSARCPWSDSSSTLLAGLSAGSLYALVALGLVLIYRSTRVLNFAHADMATVGTFIAFS